MRWAGGRGFSSIVLALATAVAVVACSTTAPSVPLGSTLSAAPAWQRLDVGEPTYLGTIEEPFASVNAQVAYGGGFVLVGTSGDETGAGRAAVWSTPDGTDWTRVAEEDDTFDGMYLALVATDGRRLVALGWASPWDNDARRGPYVAWVSEDGVRWERHDIEGTGLGQIYAEGIVGSLSGFVAWGPRPDGRYALLRSADGLAWQAIDYPGAADSTIARVAPYEDGFLAVGAKHDEGGIIGGPSPPARAWSSPDGQSWIAAAVPNGWSLRGVYPTAAGVFAVGAHECSRCVGPALAWHSPDGQIWAPLGDQMGLYPFVGSNRAQIASFEWQGDRSVALSSDGRNWRRVVANLPATEYDAGLIVGSDGVLLLVAKLPMVDGVQRVNSGVLFLRGS